MSKEVNSTSEAVAADLEGTLTTGALWRGLGRYMIQHGHGLQYRLFFLRHLPAALMARYGLADLHSVQMRWVADMASLLKGMDAAQVEQVAEWVVQNELWEKRRLEVLTELVMHQRAGRRILLVSGSFQPVVEAFGRRIGDVIAVGTMLDMQNGYSTGCIVGAVNSGKLKVEKLKEVLDGVVLEAAYGDTLPDVPMLEMSRNPVAAYPDEALRTVALARGWRVLAAHEEP